NNTLEDIERDLTWRDQNDSTRDISPLLKADDAIEIDTTNLSIEEQTQKLLQYIRKAEA
ncbi:MAG: (d)CMP kinase, partial [Candidatus Cloacimonetes bacterium]|nr:(d)CMP kinase [Candidatus Cloacimonadota bacterium]